MMIAENAVLWLIKLVLSHLLTDFILQPRKWIDQRKARHFASPYLYLHGAVTALAAWAFIGWQYWGTALAILLTHTVIDGWKSYRKDNACYFLADQALHLLVILACWYTLFLDLAGVQGLWQALKHNTGFWMTATAAVFLTMPAGILVGQLTRKWREQIAQAENLANAGKWIGMAERLIILVLVMHNQYPAIGLLIAAKSILRFNEKDRPEIKTEYLLIGTLLSIAIAIITGILLKTLLPASPAAI